MDTAYTLIAMLLAVALVGLLSGSAGALYPMLLVAAGLGIALTPGLNPPPLNPDLILLFFLPVLLYKEAFHTSWRDFSRWIRPIVMLAVGLVTLTILAVGIAANVLLPALPWGVAFILGAVVSPTDTVAVNAVRRRLRLPRRLSSILAGESLVNDATGLVALQVGIGVVLSGSLHGLEVVRDFAWTVVGGLAVGLVVGLLGQQANKLIKDTTVLFTISLVAPYAAFTGAHVIHASGVLAVVAAGFYVSWRIHTVPADTRYELYAVWRLMASIVDALCFLLIGIEIPRLLRAVEPDAMSHLLLAGALITLVVIAVRVVWMFPAAYLPLWLFPALRRHEGGMPLKRHVFLAAWCGMRGAVSLAAVLSVPYTANGQPFPGRDAIIFCTICVILGTLSIQGLTLQPLIGRLRIRASTSEGEEERLARVSMIEAALSRLEELKAQPGVDPAAVEHVKNAYVERERALVPPDRGGPQRDPSAALEIPDAVELEAIQAERQRLLCLRDAADINDMIHDRLQEELDLAEMRARTQGKLPAAD